MQSLGEIQEPPRRERPRILQALVLIIALLGLAFVIVQLVLNTGSRRMARASYRLDAMAAKKPDEDAAWELQIEADFLGNSGSIVDGVSTVTRTIFSLRPTYGDALQKQLHSATGLCGLPGHPPEIGELIWHNGNFAGGRNYITGTTYSADAGASTTRWLTTLEKYRNRPNASDRGL